MFNVGPTELMVILILALILFGPKKLPEIGRSLGKGLSEFRRPRWISARRSPGVSLRPSESGDSFRFTRDGGPRHLRVGRPG